MVNLFELAEACLFQSSISEKLSISHNAKALLDEGRLDFGDNKPVQLISAVKFPNKPVLLAPRHMPKRNLTSQDGVVAFFHAITHVEFMAISLAWDLLYRFRGLPEQFYQDWLIVADEEAQHFELLRQHLRELNVEYGDLPAHGGLWDHAVETADDLLARLALVPRCMEARGWNSKSCIYRCLAPACSPYDGKVSVVLRQMVFCRLPRAAITRKKRK